MLENLRGIFRQDEKASGLIFKRKKFFGATSQSTSFDQYRVIFSQRLQGYASIRRVEVTKKVRGAWKAFPFRPRILEFMAAKPPGFSLGGEVVAGVTVGLIALPLALALGIASIPVGTVTPFSAPALGIFTAIIGGLIISIFGGSRVQIGGPTAAFVPIILMIISENGYGGLVMATMMAGIILILMGVTRMGPLI